VVELVISVIDGNVSFERFIELHFCPGDLKRCGWGGIEKDPNFEIESEFRGIQDSIAQTSRDDATVPLDEVLGQRAHTEVFAIRKGQR
jgi:hypothetical protein